MGVSNSLDIFQDKMSKMFHGFKFSLAYIDDLLIIIKGDCSNHLDIRTNDKNTLRQRT